MTLQECCELFNRCGMNSDPSFVAEFWSRSTTSDEICHIKAELIEKFSNYNPTPIIPLSPSLYLKSDPPIMVELLYDDGVGIWHNNNFIEIDRDLSKITAEIDKMLCK